MTENQKMINYIVDQFEGRPEALEKIIRMQEEEIQEYQEGIKQLNDKADEYLSKVKSVMEPWDNLMEAHVLRARAEVVGMRLEFIERRYNQGFEAYKILIGSNC